MKNVKRLAVLFLSLLLCCCTLLTGCGNKQLKAGDVYKLQAATHIVNGTEVTVNIGQKLDHKILREDTFVLIIEENNKIILRTKEKADGDFEAVMLDWTHGYEKNEYYLWTPIIGSLYAVITFEKNALHMYFPSEEQTLIMKKA